MSSADRRKVGCQWHDASATLPIGEIENTACHRSTCRCRGELVVQYFLISCASYGTTEMALPGQSVVLRGIDDREMNRYHGNQRLREQCC